MPVRQFVGESDWQTEITGWAAALNGEIVADGNYSPGEANERSSPGAIVLNVGSFGEESGSLGANKTLKVYHRIVTGKSLAGRTQATRLYDLTAAVAISSLTHAPVGGEETYTKTTGNPITSYNYPANDVVFAQVCLIGGGCGNNFCVTGMFLGRILGA